MALEELRQRISGALKRMSKATILVENDLHDYLDEISRALLLSDFNVKLVSDMQTNIKKIINVEGFLASHKKFEIIEQAIRYELSKMLDPGKPTFTPKKGETCVVMFVGLQGSEKTTACVKYAYHHLKKGWKPALVFTDVFADGAFDPLKQNAAEAKIPFYGSYVGSDPVKIVKEGVERFKKQNCDLIIVDTNEQHKQEAALFQEMRKVYEETKPNLVILAMDSSIGQAAFDQAQAFKQSVAIGAVIVTKMDGHAKGGGALSAVAATKSPVTFIDTGKHMDEFQVFDVKTFVSHLLGTSDCSGSLSKIQEGIIMDQQIELLQKFSERSFTMRIMYEICQDLLTMSNVQQAVPMLRRFSQELMPKGHEEESIAKIKCYMTMMDSMTEKELDNPNLKIKNDSRIEEIASGCGCDVREVREMLLVYKRLAKFWNNMKWLMFRKQGHKKALIQQLGGRSGMRNSMMQLTDYCESQLRGSLSISDH